MIDRYRTWVNGNSVVLGWVALCAVVEAVVTVLSCR